MKLSEQIKEAIQLQAQENVKPVVESTVTKPEPVTESDKGVIWFDLEAKKMNKKAWAEIKKLTPQAKGALKGAAGAVRGGFWHIYSDRELTKKLGHVSNSFDSEKKVNVLRYTLNEETSNEYRKKNKANASK